MVGCKRLGWTPSEQGDLVLTAAIVDVHDADRFGITTFFNATNKHSIEFEFKLTAAESGNVLLLAGHEAHSANLIGATWRATAQLTKFLTSPTAPRYQGIGKTVSLDSYEMPEPKKKWKPHKLEKFANPREIAVEAMRSFGIFAEVVDGSGETDFGLEIRVDDANWVGAYQTTVNVNATYILTDHGTGKVLLEENVGTSATLSALDVGSGGKRMRQVTPAAFLDNIDAFLFRLDAIIGGSTAPQQRKQVFLFVGNVMRQLVREIMQHVGGVFPGVGRLRMIAEPLQRGAEHPLAVMLGGDEFQRQPKMLGPRRVVVRHGPPLRASRAPRSYAKA